MAIVVEPKVTYQPLIALLCQDFCAYLTLSLGYTSKASFTQRDEVVLAAVWSIA